MNRDLIASMREQIYPSPGARSALEAQLRRTTPRRRARHAAMAACAVLVIAAIPLCRIWGESARWQVIEGSFRQGGVVTRHHSYVVTDGLPAGNDATASVRRPEANADAGGGVQEEAAVSEIDTAAQGEAIAAYQNLMEHFAREYGGTPVWYGGAYIEGPGGLVVNIVQSFEPEDKALLLQIQEWAGSGRVSFGSTKYPLARLRELQSRAFAAMADLGLAVGCGVNEETGQVELTLSDVTDEALAILAELDPEDDAIRVEVGQNAVQEERPAVSRTIQPGGDWDGNPAGYGVADPVAEEGRPAETNAGSADTAADETK